MATPNMELWHIGYFVKDAKEVMETWERVYGIGPWTVHDLSGTDAEGRPRTAKICFADVGPVQVELIEPGNHPGLAFHAGALEKQGEGLHHLAFYVDDVDAEAARLVAQGAENIASTPGNWAYVTAPGGAVFELYQKRG